MNDLKSTRTAFIQGLKKVDSQQEADAVFMLVCEHLLGLSRVNYLLNQNQELTIEQHQAFERILDRLKNGEPVQYVLEEAWFYDLRFWVTPHVLIPRQETEELVYWILQDWQNQKSGVKLVDLGTGSGCIPIALQKNLPEAETFACDISSEALLVAQENALKNDTSIHFFKANLLQQPDLPLPLFDVMVSNPPYVTHKEKKEMHTKVLHHEPHLALFVKDEDPLIFYRAVAKLAQHHLAPHGCLYLEINQYLGAETQKMLTDLHFKTELRKDLNGNDRMLKAWL